MPAVSPSELENAREPWLTKQVGGLSRLLPHPRPALNDTFSIPTAAGLPRQVKQGKRQRSDTCKQSVHLKWKRATPLLRATENATRRPPGVGWQWRPGLRSQSRSRVFDPHGKGKGPQAPETGAGREVGPACGKVRRKPNHAPPHLRDCERCRSQEGLARNDNRGAAPVSQGPLSPRPGSPRNFRAAR